MPGRHHSVLEILRYLRNNEENAAATYEHYLAQRPLPAPALTLVAGSHRARVGWVQVQEQRFSPLKHGENSAVHPTPVIPFPALVTDLSPNLSDLYACEQATVAWYLVLSKHAPSILGQFIANRLLPEQTRITTIVGGRAHAGG